MLQHFESTDMAPPDVAMHDADPRAVALSRMLVDCCHPRVGRLTARLLECRESAQLEQLQAEVLNLLVLSFGHAETQRRLQTLQ